MLSCTWKLSAHRIPIDSMHRRNLSNLDYVIKYGRYSNSCELVVKKVSTCVNLALFAQHSCRALQKDIFSGPMPLEIESCKVEVESDLKVEPGKMQADSPCPILGSFDNKGDEKIQRMEKVGHGNKGRVPWNKGRKHSEGTRARIGYRTKEALKDPKIRKKMREAPRTLSDQTKKKIRKSLTMLWGKRLKWKRSREKFMQLWAETIATAAKIGGLGQQELDWDSYNKLKREMALQWIHQAAQKAKAKEAARVRAERAAQLKAEKTAIRVLKRREREERAKARGESVRKRERKSKEEKEKLAEFQEVKLKERLLKIQKKKPTINQVSNQPQRPWEKFDMDLVKQELSQKKISLADQIRVAKNRRVKQTA